VKGRRRKPWAERETRTLVSRGKESDIVCRGIGARAPPDQGTRLRVLLLLNVAQRGFAKALRIVDKRHHSKRRAGSEGVPVRRVGEFLASIKPVAELPQELQKNPVE
jgi:hypothetical protein